MLTRAVLAIVVLAACDSGGGTEAPKVDAPPPAAVEALASCPTTADATVMDSATAFVPKMTTIAAKGVVKFQVTAEHSVIPNTLMTTDPLLTVKRGETKCFRFNTAGTYNFLCGVHSFTGSITVQ